MKHLSPQTLKKVINGDSDIKRAIAVLKNQWMNVYDSNPLANNQIDNATINLAKQLQATGVIDSKINFDDYKSVHNFVINNDKYLNPRAKQLLLSSFD